MYDVLRADRCISVNSLEARVPFGDLDFVQYVMELDPAKKMNVYNKGKYLLRHAFEGLGYLPDEILWREKAAFTKESLLYREIFESFYPGQAEMVKDFWMPNKEWEGCNVNDPSARVLSNYGASGE